MKTRFLRILTLFMACVVLFTSTGFGLVEHSCAMRGKSVRLTHAIHQSDGSCCAAPSTMLVSQNNTSKTPQIQKAPCCKEEQRFEKVEGGSMTEFVGKMLKKAVDTVLYTIAQIAIWCVEAIITLIQSIASKTAFLSFFGRSFLAFAQIFLI